VLENLDIPKTAANPELRAQIEKDIAEVGLAAVFKRLVALDPEAAYVVDSKNPRRVVRALEVALATGVPFTAQRTKRAPFFDALVLGLNPAPEILRGRIDRRVDVMMRDGLVDEVATLIKKFGRTSSAFDAIGFREIIDSLNGERSIEDAVAAIKINTWRYAKRQMTWFKKSNGIHWIEGIDEALPLSQNFLH
jgi:tRNA dimethylallyltransferase